MKAPALLRSFLAVAGSVALLSIPSVTAQTWDGSDGNLWSTAANWSVAPVDGNALTFSGTTNQTNTNDTSLTNIGLLTLTGAGWNIDLGTLTLNSGISASGTSSLSGTHTLGAAQTWQNSTGLLSIAGPVSNGGFLLTASGNGNTAVSGAISGAGGLTKSGTGTLTLSSASNNYSGTTAITGGVLDVGDMSSGALSSNSYLTIGSSSQLQGYGTFNRAFSTTVSGNNWGWGTTKAGGFSARGGKLTVNTGTISIFSSEANPLIFNNSTSDSELEWQSSILIGNNGTRNITVNAGANANSFVTISGQIVRQSSTDGAIFTKVGSGMLVLTNTTNNWGGSSNGGTVVQAGTLVAGADVAATGTSGLFGHSNNGTVANTGAIGAVAVGNAATTASNAPTLLVNGGFTMARAIQVGALGNTAAYNATLGGNNTSGTSTFTGAITLGTAATNYTATLRAATGGTVDFQGAWTTNDKAIAIGSSGNTGTVKLSSNLSTTGGINVNYGTLAVNSTVTSAITVASGATLQGSGTINSSVTINSGGTLASGNSIESLGTGTLNIAANATFAYEIDKSAAAGLAGDLTFITGDLNLDVLTNASILTLSELGLSGSWDLNETLTLISYTGNWNGGLFNYESSVISDGATFVFNGTTWQLDYDNTVEGGNYTADSTGRYVTMTVIPEPSTALLGGLGMLLLLRRRR